MWPLLVSLLVGGVEVAPGTPCVDARSAERLAAQVPAEVTVSLAQASPAVLVVVLSSPGRTSLRREVPASAPECDAVERVVLALARSWLSTPVVSARPKPGDAGVLRSETGTSSSSDASVPSGVTGADAGARDGLSRTSAADASVRDALSRSSSGFDAGVPSGVSGADPAARDALRTSGVDASVRGAPSRTTSESDAGMPSRVDASVLGAPSRTTSESDASVREAPSRTPSEFDAGARDSLSRRSSGTDVVESSGVGGAAAGSPSGPDASGTDAGVRDGPVADVGPVDAGASEIRVGLSVLGGVSSGTTPDVLPQGLLSFDLVWRWLGVALDVGLSGGVRQPVAPGEIVASWQWLSLSGRAVWSPTERLLLDVQLGARAHRLVASATGFTMNEPAQTLFSVGGVGSLGASLRLLGPFGVTVRATGVLKPPERFVITNVSQALDFGSLEGAVHAGLFARW